MLAAGRGRYVAFSAHRVPAMLLARARALAESREMCVWPSANVFAALSTARQGRTMAESAVKGRDFAATRHDRRQSGGMRTNVGRRGRARSHAVKGAK